MVYENGFVTIHLNFSRDDVEWMRQKFDLETKEDLVTAVVECITTYMEL